MNMNTETVANSKELDEKKMKKIDFKMVTFTLAGKDYGIDIMKVREIHKAEKFTFVPNSSPFVRGVYNMRGDIISVIDLRVFFNLPVEKNEKRYENMIILRLEDNTIGVLVDTIEKVIGIDSSRKQPPHPLFGDINIKYIESIVENDDSLYIILEAEKIFSSETITESRTPEKAIPAASAVEEIVFDANAIRTEDNSKALNIGFIEETLPTYAGFYPTALNRDWVIDRFDSWEKQRGSDNTQLDNKEDADAYLRGFNSPFTGELWGDEYISALTSMLPEKSGNVFVWNPGCSRGYESYSIAAVLKSKNPEILLKIQGNDNDLINISSAPGLMIEKGRVPSFYDSFLVSSEKGTQFNEVIKDSLIFEYHDLNNDTSLPPLDFVVCRDTLSYMNEAVQLKVLEKIYESMKPGGLLMLGINEKPSNGSNWELIENNGLKLYKKK
ncbi:MAG: hypothetical protein B6241_06670 [Spirochaetaceae bacterium 4572_59]|nr:MAG: hypothetical protein B6241_06670 [Spirochaetaceae bacterium 4572_59]